MAKNNYSAYQIRRSFHKFPENDLFITEEEIKELRRIAKEEYNAIPEEEHQRRIAEQHAANRERYEKKMMRKGYK